MKRTLSILVLSIITFIFIACDKEGENVIPSPVYITVIQKGGSYPIDVSANCSWRAEIRYPDESVQGYARLDKSSGKGNGTITLIVDENNGPDFRNFSIDFHNGVCRQRIVSIIQNGLIQKVPGSE